MRVYIAGPYRASTPQGVSINIVNARYAMFDLIRAGHTPFCPHTMTGEGEIYASDITDDQWLELGLNWLESCECVLLLLGWQNSKGTLAEKAKAEAMGLPIYYRLSEIPS